MKTITDRDLLDTVLKRLDTMEANMATKNELAEIKANMATKDELAEIKANMATKNELAEIEANMATKNELAEIKANMATKNDIADINRKLDAVYEQTAMLTEFRTEINHRLDDIANTVEYLMHKDSQTEKELFSIKKSISNK